MWKVKKLRFADPSLYRQLVPCPWAPLEHYLWFFRDHLAISSPPLWDKRPIMTLPMYSFCTPFSQFLSNLANSFFSARWRTRSKVTDLGTVWYRLVRIEIQSGLGRLFSARGWCILSMRQEVPVRVYDLSFLDISFQWNWCKCQFLKCPASGVQSTRILKMIPTKKLRD